tara:strand:+ start:12269 stop:12988 length:720 start_codon:yes stop_codon:yes gene_type:complete
MRNKEIDLIKGISVIFMVIFHYFYVGSKLNKLTTNTTTGILHFIAVFAHTTFIICMGINSVFSLENHKKKNKSDKEYYHKLFNRVLLFSSIAFFMSFSSYLIFGFDKFIKFGIFHYMTFGTIIISYFADKPKFAILFSMLLLLIKDYKNPNLNKLLGCITGYNMIYGSLDYFPLNKWLPYSLLGVVLGNNLNNNKNFTKQINNIIDNNTLLTLICKLGSNTIPIYISHFVIFYLFFVFQ